MSQLENLIITLMQQPASIASPHSIGHTDGEKEGVEDCAEIHRPVSPSPSDYGSIIMGSTGTSYVGSAHWSAILDSITELKNDLELTDEDEADVPRPYCPGPQLLYGYAGQVSKNVVLGSIPPRQVVDRLVSRYFNALDMAPGR